MKEKILAFLQQKGPVVPIEVASLLKMDSMFASAYLSDLVRNKQVFISSVKVGSSPLYYLPEHKDRLEAFSDNLHEKERAVFNKLKEQKVLRDTACSPVERVALRNIKDFAVPLEVTFQERKEVFWKWHSLQNEEAAQEIKKLVEQPTPQQEQPVPKPVPQEKPVERPIEPSKEKPLPKPEKKEQVKEEKQQVLKKDTSDTFLAKVTAFLERKDIQVEEATVLRKNSEADLILLVPTALGEMKFFARAKNKKRLNEKDLSEVYAQGEIKKLPRLLISPGELTKSAKESSEKEFKSVTVVVLPQ